MEASKNIVVKIQHLQSGEDVVVEIGEEEICGEIQCAKIVERLVAEAREGILSQVQLLNLRHAYVFEDSS